MACGVPATGNSLRVALFTPTSVAWADSSTAASSSNGVVYSSSVLGMGLAAFKVAKKGSMSDVFMGAGCVVYVLRHAGLRPRLHRFREG
ncbi:hypothetical protein D3C71_1378530 [compost metagenome]